MIGCALFSGDKVMERFPQENMEDYIEMYRDFEVKKRCIDTGKEGKITFKLPVAFTELVQDVAGESFASFVKKSPYADKIVHKGK